MMHVFSTVAGTLQELTEVSSLPKGVWISLVNPTGSELHEVSQATGVPAEFLRAALDEEEKPRIEIDPTAALVLINIPVLRTNARVQYDTLPLGIIVTEAHFITVSLENNEVLQHLRTTRPGVETGKKTRLLLQILLTTATLYLKYLRQIDRRTDEIEAALHRAMKNEQLIKMLELQKSLVYFSTSLRSNQIVMERLLRGQLRKDPDPAAEPRLIKMYADDEDLLEDVITENRQAIEMSDVYSSILNGMMDAFASVISNNLNNVMKYLTSVTIVLAIPTIVASIYGMNVPLPGYNNPWAFPILLLVSLLLCAGAAWGLARKGMF